MRTLLVGMRLVMVGCSATPCGPTTAVYVGKEKSFEQYQRDADICRDYASTEVARLSGQGVPPAVKTGLVTGALGAATGAAIGAVTGRPGGGAMIGAASGVTAGTAVGAMQAGQAGDKRQRAFDTRTVKYSNLPSIRGDNPPSPVLWLEFHPCSGSYSPLIGTEEAGVERRMGWKTLLAYITGTVDQELLLRNEYLVTENRILRKRITGRVRLTDGERKTLAEIGQKLGKQALAEVVTLVKPDTILAWHRQLVAKKFDGSQKRRSPGRPTIDAELETLVVHLAQENRSWGYDRMVGALAHLGYTISDQTIGNILKRHGIPPAPERKKSTTWKEFIGTHMDVLVATDFFTAEVWTWDGLMTYYVLFFIHLSSRKVHVAGVTPHPDERWMVQIARNVTMGDWGFLSSGQYLIYDRDGKFCPVFQQIIDAAGVKRVPLPPRSPDLNAYAERWVRSVKEEALSRLILFGDGALRHALKEYVAHYHEERPHRGKGNVLLFPVPSQRSQGEGPLRCRERLGGLLKYYDREAA